jgi:hypothetical protein
MCLGSGALDAASFYPLVFSAVLCCSSVGCLCPGCCLGRAVCDGLQIFGWTSLAAGLALLSCSMFLC